MLHEFELGYNASEATKNICCAKSNRTVDHSTVNKWLKKFRSGCNNIDDQEKLGRPKIVNSETVFQAIDANPVCSTWKVSGNRCTSQRPQEKYSELRPCDLRKSIQSCRIVLHVTKILQNFWLTLKIVLIIPLVQPTWFYFIFNGVHENSWNARRPFESQCTKR